MGVVVYVGGGLGGDVNDVSLRFYGEIGRLSGGRERGEAKSQQKQYRTRRESPISDASWSADWGCASSGAARMLVRCSAECQRERRWNPTQLDKHSKQGKAEKRRSIQRKPHRLRHFTYSGSADPGWCRGLWSCTRDIPFLGRLVAAPARWEPGSQRAFGRGRPPSG